MDEKYFAEKLLEMGLEDCDSIVLPILKQIANDQREANVGKIERLFEKYNHLGQQGMRAMDVLDEVLAALREEDK
jgi:hypothetical protein